ncbi:MAG: hypothetical protein UT28_C0001G0233 [Berkelbacteria bacterium GW2011_GWE1_39_12]|uniref:Uncharacterized protein n=1 Tax=Berkelbacteria bacterium GW2011_GWE1_39_12 TaxID=1618337 RepID=A0A0G4B2F4_9BACT|nr:MAG: hypothetical protein UT28_C0001G0233 [Berkelbacteria bacterium GW2011_GWE1_39_12]
MDQKTRPVVSRWLWIILAIIVVLAAGFFSWYYLSGPGKKVTATTASATATVETAAPDQLLAGYSKYSNDTYGFNFQYPETWTSTKSETNTESSQGKIAKDLVFKVRYYDPNAVKKEGPNPPDDVYMRVYKKNSDFTNLNAWLVSTFKLPNTELEDYQVGSEISLGGLKGYYSSIGCCAGVDRNYVVEKGNYIYSLGSSHFDSSITDKDMPATFQKIAPTVKITTASAAADWKTYNNSTYGFQLTFTDSWKNYAIEEMATGSSGGSAGYIIAVPSTNNKDVMSIIIYTPDAYAKAVAAADPAPGKVIGQTPKYVYTYIPSNGLNGEPDSTFYSTYIPNLVKTFKAL